MDCDTTYQIRLARAEELPKLGAVELSPAQRFASTPHSYVCTAPTLSLEILEAQLKCDGVWVAVQNDGDLIGFAVAGMLGDEAYLYEVDVDHRWSGRGIGRRLLNAVFDWAVASGFRTLTLSTFVDVPWNAPFYERLGFQAIPEAELTQVMVETREAESKAGLLIERRVFMRRSMRQPN